MRRDEAILAVGPLSTLLRLRIVRDTRKIQVSSAIGYEVFGVWDVDAQAFEGEVDASLGNIAEWLKEEATENAPE